ncbi:MAG: 2,3,4,5-tetrahydropyridine-2,6-dicarboxylate N-succinyltransferase [Legionellales bacterium]|nr:2,3,4,5-tetrahydropyridine-2,6-dicarboxylate N-succinyltransferase [Legionellales bacterium]
MTTLQTIIETAFAQRQQLTPQHCDLELMQSILQVIAQLDSGELRIAEKIDGQWRVHEWLKKAVLLYFKVMNNDIYRLGDLQCFDKVPLKFQHYDQQRFNAEKIRVVPHAVVRHGAFVGNHTVLMPSYINIGAYVDSGCMIDTWATVGSCAQIGKNVHLSGGAGIGGVLEPLQANPTIIEDNVFIGARSEIVEGVIVEENSVIAMGTFIGQSTRIYDRATGETYFGRVPAGSVVVPGSLPAKNGAYSLNCAIIVKTVDEQTRRKTAINELLRGYD